MEAAGTHPLQGCRRRAPHRVFGVGRSATRHDAAERASVLTRRRWRRRKGQMERWQHRVRATTFITLGRQVIEHWAVLLSRR